VVGLVGALLVAGVAGAGTTSTVTVGDLPQGPAPKALELPHFPSAYHAFVWRNWEFVGASKMAEVVGATAGDVLRTGRAMGLQGEPGLPGSLKARAAVSLIRRNWHLLPYEQLLQLLDWTPDELAFALREDDFLFIKLGSLKPTCPPIGYAAPTAAVGQAEKEIAAIVRAEFPEGACKASAPLFGFVQELSALPSPAAKTVSLFNDFVTTAGTAAALTTTPATAMPRICYSYFALYGDPLLSAENDPYPEGLLARLAEVGVNGIWLQGILGKLAPFPWDDGVSAGYETRIANLRKLVARARRHGIGVYLYLNEPRAMPLQFFDGHLDLKGVTVGDHATLCTSAPPVAEWITGALGYLAREVPDLAGIFTISASENPTNCWSHGRGGECPRCAKLGAPAVIANLHETMLKGLRATGGQTRLIAWDWGWAPEWSGQVIERLPQDVTLMSTSEWDIPIARGGVKTTVGEYSMSVVGPGPRAERHWAAANARGLATMAKIQAGNTWELSAVPYIPVAENVARHCEGLRDRGVRGLLMGWTLGGYPSPNLEVASLVSGSELSAEEALQRVSERRFGKGLAPVVRAAWSEMSTAFAEFPFHIQVVYSGPLQLGPANLLWKEPTRYSATMVGFPYDDTNAWRAVYPAEVYAGQLVKVADGFDAASGKLQRVLEKADRADAERDAAATERRFAEVAAIHFRSGANQARFVTARNAAADATTSAPARAEAALSMRRLLDEEVELARRLKRLQEQDSRIGFEASNQYYYTPLDLVEKVVNCRWLLQEMER